MSVGAQAGPAAPAAATSAAPDAGTGGAVTRESVIAQLLYEINGPDYANPDIDPGWLWPVPLGKVQLGYRQTIKSRPFIGTGALLVEEAPLG